MFVWTWQQQSLFVRHWQCLTMTMFEPSCTTNTNTNTMNTNTNTIQYIYIHIHIFVRIVFQIKRLFWSGLQIFQSIFSQFSEVYVFFRIFDIFQIFNFFAQLFLQIFWSIFPNGPPGYFFEFTKVFFSKFWRSISLNFEYLS